MNVSVMVAAPLLIAAIVMTFRTLPIDAGQCLK
jgi:hypothetical protein